MKYLAWTSGFTYDVDRMNHEMLVSRTLGSITSLPCSPNLRNRFRWIRLPFLGKLSLELLKTLEP